MDMASHEERAALVALLQVRPGGMKWADITAEVVEAGSALRVWERLVQPSLMPSPGEADPLESAAGDIAAWAAQGHAMLTVLDGEYPARLRGVHQAPPVLFALGSVSPHDRAVSVVGSRQASERGLGIAAGIARGLVEREVTVMAGLALGIDTAAHRAALDAGGRTVAVIGTGINKVYPAANRDLHGEIAERGLLLSQFWPDAPPQKHTFLMRNATMSGYGLATVVVEAGEHSGARAQARLAVEHGRPVVLTDLVVERNRWAKELVGRPGVHVASVLWDVFDAIDGLIQEETLIDAELRRLVSA
ncbi:DNA-processing protein DprA [Actinomadura parmotrematis]|uniref:DNA-protecting protein DprA n=1 Tax=Actinomadura parmotrematis TaxID=2864039 RepID=A0ABS7FS21_9ACTN|nr:DNA-processing protein DprA [Actinomadura parmotrematis]MBW8483010.1 DNA-protecting protein DprA [Actinomadura parmotrematis]